MRRRRKVKRQQDGYTLIEVMMAVSIMIIGAVGIMQMQAATTRGNGTARKITTATEVTQVWLQRFRTDSLSWNTAATPTGTVNLNAVPAAPMVGAWFQPAVFGGGQPAFDFLGQDTATAALGTTGKYYCVNARLRWVIPNEAIRVDIRTWWPRQSANAATTNYNAFQNCNGGNVAGVTTELNAAVPRIRAVFASTVLRWNRRQ